VGGDVDDAQFPSGEHHGDAGRVGVVGEDFGVAGEVVAGEVEGFFVERGGDDGIDAAGHREFDGGADGLEGGVAGGGGDLAELEVFEVEVGEGENVDGGGVEDGVFGALDGAELEGGFDDGDSALHDSEVADDEPALVGSAGGAGEGFGDDLRADAGGVTHGDGECMHEEECSGVREGSQLDG